MSQFNSAPLEGYIPVGNARLFYREVGRGQPVVVLHGGPEFDHSYLLPDVDRLSDSLRLIYYDQRGRGNSAENVRPEDVTIQSEVEDLETLRKHFQLESVAVLGHSWGGLLAMEYAIRHQKRISHLILMNTAPASRDDNLLFRQDRLSRSPADMEKLKEISSTAEFQHGDPDTVADYFRVHYRATIRQPEDLERVVQTLRASFTSESILKGWEIEDRLMSETLLAGEYDLVPKLKELSIPALILHGDDDFVPIDCALHVAEAMPHARFVLLKECGHFSYLECPDQVHEEIGDFFRGVRQSARLDP